MCFHKSVSTHTHTHTQTCGCRGGLRDGWTGSRFQASSARAPAAKATCPISLSARTRPKTDTRHRMVPGTPPLHPDLVGYCEPYFFSPHGRVNTCARGVGRRWARHNTPKRPMHTTKRPMHTTKETLGTTHYASRLYPAAIRRQAKSTRLEACSVWKHAA